MREDWRTVHTHVGSRSALFCFLRKSLHSGLDPFRRINVRTRLCRGTDKHGAKLVLTRVTRFNTGDIVQRDRLFDAMGMRRRPVVMLWMIVIGVGVNVQRRHGPDRRHKRPDEY